MQKREFNTIAMLRFCTHTYLMYLCGMKQILLTLFFMVTALSVRANGTDSIRFSLLTCGPGTEIYSLFGHTAIRYEVPERGIDVVFNYGLFSFGAPNFILRFTLGEPDYQLGVTDYRRFIAEYTWSGRDVWEQELNLTDEEKHRLATQLEENYRPENRVYRYNIFYDNCATRPCLQVERATGNRLHYADDMETTDTQTSFRDIVHQYSKGHSWAEFGMDLCLGSPADRPISRRLMTFAPFYLKDFFATAMLPDSAGAYTRPLVAETVQTVVIPDEEKETTDTLFTPLAASLALLIVVGGATWYGLRRQKSLWGLDFVLFLAAGLAGCILTFLSLLSQHPAVRPNYLLLVFHPFHLLCLPWMINRVRKHRLSRYMAANVVVLTFFILLWPVIPQKFNLAVLPLALCLLIRSASNLFLTYKNKTDKKQA